MIVFAILFAGLAIVGALVGLEHVGEPVSGQLPVSYGWALCINAAVIAAFLIYNRVRNSPRSRR